MQYLVLVYCFSICFIFQNLRYFYSLRDPQIFDILPFIDNLKFRVHFDLIRKSTFSNIKPTPSSPFIFANKCHNLKKGRPPEEEGFFPTAIFKKLYFSNYDFWLNWSIFSKKNCLVWNLRKRFIAWYSSLPWFLTLTSASFESKSSSQFLSKPLKLFGGSVDSKFLTAKIGA